MEPDYQKYTLEELHDVKENIDPELYPERFKSLITELKCRGIEIDSSPEPNAEETEEVEEDGFVIRVLAALCALFFGYSLVVAFVDEKIRGRGSGLVELSANPFKFYIYVIVQFLFFLVMLYFWFRKPNKNKNN